MQVVPAGHRRPQDPQLLLLCGVSHPFWGRMSQSSQPLSHETITQAPDRHTNDAHVGASKGRAHEYPQDPQFVGEFAMSTSQPLLPTPSQLANPLLQVGVQAEFTHA